MQGVRHFATIDAFYDYLRNGMRCPGNDLHIYRYEDFPDHSRWSMPPHTKEFHQLSFITDFGESRLNINGRVHADFAAALYFISPDHVYAWSRAPGIRGFIVNFRKDVLPLDYGDFHRQFSIFGLHQPNVVELQSFAHVHDEFRGLYRLYQHRLPMQSLQPVYYRLLSVLSQCEELLQQQRRTLEAYDTSWTVYTRFVDLVREHYVEHRDVATYCRLLGVSRSQLYALTDRVAGRSPLRIIEQELLKQALHLLRYTPLRVSEIAYRLRFSSPSNFSRFIRRLTGRSPGSHRLLSTN